MIKAVRVHVDLGKRAPGMALLTSRTQVCPHLLAVYTGPNPSP